LNFGTLGLHFEHRFICLQENIWAFVMQMFLFVYSV